MKILWCNKCRWSDIFEDDTASVNSCGNCGKHGLQFMQFTHDEWKALEGAFKEREVSDKTFPVVSEDDPSYPDLRPYGWAPGGYRIDHSCQDCGGNIDGDKRCTRCLECACVEFYKESLRTYVRRYRRLAAGKKTELEQLERLMEEFKREHGIEE